jgi:hypothetical protein
LGDKFNFGVLRDMLNNLKLISMKKTLKKIVPAIVFIALALVSAQAQTTKKMTPKNHTCSKQCTKGNHIYKHGEKGHVCNAACKPK